MVFVIQFAKNGAQRMAAPIFLQGRQIQEAGNELSIINRFADLGLRL